MIRQPTAREREVDQQLDDSFGGWTAAAFLVVLMAVCVSIYVAKAMGKPWTGSAKSAETKADR